MMCKRCVKISLWLSNKEPEWRGKRGFIGVLHSIKSLVTMVKKNSRRNSARGWSDPGWRFEKEMT